MDEIIRELAERNVYGKENTSLNLSSKAEKAYSGGEDIITEIVYEVGTSDQIMYGEAEKEYRYVVSTRGYPVGSKEMTEKEINEYFESIEDEAEAIEEDEE